LIGPIEDSTGLWRLHDYLTEKRKETDEKYDYRYSVLRFVFARLICEGWMHQEDIKGISDLMPSLRDPQKMLELSMNIVRRFSETAAAHPRAASCGVFTL
jgi:hypothetical protein